MAIVLSLLILSLVACVLVARFGTLLLLSLTAWICDSRCTHPLLPRSMTEYTCFNCWMHSRVEKLAHDIGNFFEMVREYFTSAEFWLSIAAIVVLLILAIV
jgi:hypothetical protein